MHRTAPLALLAASLLLAADLRAQDRTWTTTADFEEGTLINVTAGPPDADQLQLRTVAETAPLPFVNVASSGRGTLVRVDANTGAILGEYATAPDGFLRNPSRTAVDPFGNVWVTNRQESSRSKGSVVKIGVVVGGTRVNADGTPNPFGGYLAPPYDYTTCVDRDGDGLLRTSRGLGDVLSWANATDGAGGATALVEDATDECILVFQRTSGVAAHHVSIAPSGDVWVGGYPFMPEDFDRLDPDTGAILQTVTPSCGGFGGVTDGMGRIWSASLGEGRLLRYDPQTAMETCIPLPKCFGVALDGAGNVWCSTFDLDLLVRVAPDGTTSSGFPTGGASNDRGVCVTPADGHVWVANSAGSDVSRLAPDGTLLEVVPLGAMGQEPTGLAVDPNGKVWVTNQASNTAQRIDPAAGPSGLGAVDLTVDLGPNCVPFNYSDMTGVATAAFTAPSGLWRVVHDGGMVGTVWQRLVWDATVRRGTELAVQVRAANALADLGGEPWTDAVDGAALAGVVGRYAELRVRFTRPATTNATPVLREITLEALGDGPEEPDEEGALRQPASLLVFPEFDSRPASATFLTVTRTALEGGDLDVEFVYIGRVGSDGELLPCYEFNRTHRLTPGDTLTVLARSHAPGHERGYVYVFAKDPQTGQAVSADELVGSALIADAVNVFSYSHNPYAFRSLAPPGAPTDLDGDGLRDLDGMEYGRAPDELLVPRFLGQDEVHRSELVLLNLTGGTSFDATARLLIYNDNEEVFSRDLAFRCWIKAPLAEISVAFTQAFLATTQQDPGEVLGAPERESGWFRIDGLTADSSALSLDDPALLGVLIERAGPYAASDLPFERGLQGNGDLLPTGVLGDPVP